MDAASSSRRGGEATIASLFDMSAGVSALERAVRPREERLRLERGVISDEAPRNDADEDDAGIELGKADSEGTNADDT